MVGAEVVVISDIHRAENVTDVRLLTVGELKVGKILQTCNCKIAFIFLFAKENFSIDSILGISYKFCEIRVFITRHDTPRTGVIAFNARTDVLDYESCRILCGIHFYVLRCNFFENCEMVNKVVIVVNESFTKCGEFFVRSGFATFCTTVVSSVACFRTSRCLSFKTDPVVTESGNEYVCVTKCTQLSFCTSSLCTGYMRKLVNRNGSNGYSTTISTFLTCGRTKALASRSNCGDFHFCVAVRICIIRNVAVATIKTSVSCIALSCASGGSYYCAIVVTKCCYGFLFYGDNSANSTLLTFGKTGSSTSRCNCHNSFFVMTKCFNNVGCISITAARAGISGITFCSTCGSHHFCIVVVIKGFNHGLSHDNLTTTRTLLTFGKTGFATSRCYRRNNFLSMNMSHPYAVGICIGIGSPFNICSVSILKLRGSNRNSLIRITTIFISCHNSRGFCTHLKFYYGTIFTVDISTASCSIRISLRTIKNSITLYINFSIHKIRICTCICSSGSILYRNKCLIRCTCKSSPFISIKHVNLHTGSKTKFCIRTND